MRLWQILSCRPRIAAAVVHESLKVSHGQQPVEAMNAASRAGRCTVKIDLQSRSGCLPDEPGSHGRSSMIRSSPLWPRIEGAGNTQGCGPSTCPCRPCRASAEGLYPGVIEEPSARRTKMPPCARYERMAAGLGLAGHPRFPNVRICRCACSINLFGQLRPLSSRSAQPPNRIVATCRFGTTRSRSCYSVTSR